MDKEYRVGYRIRKTDNILMRNFQLQINHALGDPSTAMHSWILDYLYQHRGEEVFQKDLETPFCIGRSTVTNIVKLMEKKGYITRESVEGDARLKKLVLTQEGIAMHQKAEQAIVRLEQENVKGISSEEITQLFEILEKISRNAERQMKETC